MNPTVYKLKLMIPSLGQESFNTTHTHTQKWNISLNPIKKINEPRCIDSKDDATEKQSKMNGINLNLQNKLITKMKGTN